MPLKLISATPSAYARMNRIALIEKGIPFELQNEIPWHSDTQTPQFNPLEKLPILVLEDGKAVYDSAHIQEYIIQKYADKGPRLIPEGVDVGLQALQIQVLAEGHLDAMSLLFFEVSREKPSKEWTARQNRKIDGAMKAYAEMVEDVKGGWLVGGAYSIADIAVACAVRGVEQTNSRPGWQEQYPGLAKWWESLESRDSFKQTVPILFEITEKIV